MSQSRRSSVSSIASDTGPATPLLGEINDPNSREPPLTLILVHDDDAPNEAFDFSSDDDLDDDFSTQIDRLNASAIPALPPTLAFLYLLVPYLKLGPVLLLHTDMPLSHSIPALFLFAALAASTRHMWYMLAKYVGKPDLEEIVLNAFARERERERLRLMLRSSIRLGSGVFAVLLAAVYLRVSVDVLTPLFPAKMILPSRTVLTVGLSLVLFPLCIARSIRAKRVLYATWASLLAYIVWLVAVSVAHARGTFDPSTGWSSAGFLSEGLALVAFTFTSSWTLPIYASLKASSYPNRHKKSRRRSFKALLIIAALLAVCLTLPLCFFVASPNPPEASAIPPDPVIAIANSAILLLTIPCVLVVAPSLPVPTRIRRSTNVPISKLLLYLSVIVLSLLSSRVSAALSDSLLVLALLSTYTVPALLHIVIHEFRSPLSIILPTSNPGSPATPSSDPTNDLLLRKERTLQRRRLGKRLAWDVCAWLLLVLSGGGTVWAGGRLAERW